MVTLLAPLWPDSTNSPERRNIYLSKIGLLKGKITTQILLDQISANNRILVEHESRLSNPYLLRAINYNPRMICALCLSTKTAYNIDLVSLFEDGVTPNCKAHPLLLDQIVTTCQEAFANAILWSNLELKSSAEKLRPLSFTDEINQRLSQSPFKKRTIVILFSHHGSYLELSISVEGKPIIWPELTNSIKPEYQNFRGVAIIKSLTDKIEFADNNQTLRLMFSTQAGEKDDV